MAQKNTVVQIFIAVLSRKDQNGKKLTLKCEPNPSAEFIWTAVSFSWSTGDMARAVLPSNHPYFNWI